MQKPKGTYDLYGDEIKYWQYLEETIKNLCKEHNFSEIRTPIFESYETFHRSVSDSSDMVQKETYDFCDRSNRKLTLRPEGTAGVVRSFVENKLYTSGFQKYYYIGPMFRYERSQKGRYRQFAQFGLEAFGSLSPALDAEVIITGYRLLENLGLKNIKLRLNTLGSFSERETYLGSLKSYFSSHTNELCSDCLNRLTTNPLRILDCKVDRNKPFFLEAPLLRDFLSEESNIHFNEVLKILDSLQIPYEYDPYLVRGLDYYTDTVFEYDFTLNEQPLTLGGGGRYNGLVSEFKGPETASCGFAFGLERLVIALKEEGITLPKSDLNFFIIPLEDKLMPYAFQILSTLRSNHYTSDISFVGGNLKKQFKEADKCNPAFTIIIGNDELENKTLQLRNNTTKDQTTIEYKQLINYLKSFK